MSEAIFLRLLSYEDKAEGLRDSVRSLSKGETKEGVIHVVDTDSFGEVPGTPFAYWVDESIRRLFSTLPPLEIGGREAQSGASTMNDFRFLRCWWEVDPKLAARSRSMTVHGKRWVPFAKGGAYSKFYCDWELVVDWANDGEIMKREVAEYRGSRGWGYQWTAAINGHSFYFQPGLTWPRRTTSGISVRVLPAGCIFADKGPAIFTSDNELGRLLALMNARPFEGLIAVQLGAADVAARSYEVGVIEKTPLPDLSGPRGQRLEEMALTCVRLSRLLDRVNETSHIFHLPALLCAHGGTLVFRANSWHSFVLETKRKITEYQAAIDEIAFRLYAMDESAKKNVDSILAEGDRPLQEDGFDTEIEIGNESDQFTANAGQLIASLISYLVGCVVGQWDIRHALSENHTLELPDPFSPLPVCAPGALTGSDALPLRKSPPGYPLRFDWNGILVDDPEHDDDIIRRVRDVFELIWLKRAEEIEREGCELLGVKTLRDYFRKPAAGGFWTYHVKRYSKSRRKAPIYWLLRSAKGNYAIWLYHHRLDKDILFKVLLNYVEPKLRLEENNLAQLKRRREAVGTTGREGKQLERDLDKQESFISELYDFRDKLKRAADLNLEPDLNDGVVLNISPLWELVPWKEAEKYWKELIAGKYEWSSIAKQLRERGLVKQ